MSHQLLRMACGEARSRLTRIYAARLPFHSEYGMGLAGQSAIENACVDVRLNPESRRHRVAAVLRAGTPQPRRTWGRPRAGGPRPVLGHIPLVGAARHLSRTR